MKSPRRRKRTPQSSRASVEVTRSGVSRNYLASLVEFIASGIQVLLKEHTSTNELAEALFQSSSTTASGKGPWAQSTSAAAIIPKRASRLTTRVFLARSCALN